MGWEPSDFYEGNNMNAWVMSCEKMFWVMSLDSERYELMENTTAE